MRTVAPRPPFVLAVSTAALACSCSRATSIVSPPIVGAFTSYSIPTQSSNVSGIVAGPDGALWFTERYGNRIGRITTAGTVTEFPLGPYGGAGGARPVSRPVPVRFWFGEPLGGAIGRMTTAGGGCVEVTPAMSFPAGAIAA
jgi:hypothetical protein